MNRPSKDSMRACDAVVVGAGLSGSAAAWKLSQAGLKVIIIEERDRIRAGAGCNHEIAPWMIERAGIDYQITKATNPLTGPVTLMGRNSAAQVAIDENPLCVVDMRALITHLQESAQACGVEILSRTRAARLEFDGERPVTLQAEALSSQGKKQRIDLRARLFVDASGVQGALRKLVPILAQACPEIDPSDTCAAAKEVCLVKGKAQAQSFLERYGLQPGGMVVFAGINGGFSLLCINVHPDLQRVEIGCKTIADEKHISGADWIGRIKEQEPWIGKRIAGGQGLIPLRKPYKQLVAPGIALIGDAACQVYSVTGSGAGLGLVAARMLSDAVLTASDPGSIETLLTYQSSFEKEFGRRLLLSDIARRALQSLLEDEVELLIGSGLIQPMVIRSILTQTTPKPADLDFALLARSIKEIPGLAMRLLPHITKAAMAIGMFEARQRKNGISEIISRFLEDKN
jgi:flavin-dependent dehydrogenase